MSSWFPPRFDGDPLKDSPLLLAARDKGLRSALARMFATMRRLDALGNGNNRWPLLDLFQER
jgi:hypothetical protein